MIISIFMDFKDNSPSDTDKESGFTISIFDRFLEELYTPDIGNNAPKYVQCYESDHDDDPNTELISEGIDPTGSNFQLIRQMRPFSCDISDITEFRYTKIGDNGKPSEITYPDGIVLPIPIRYTSIDIKLESAKKLLASDSKQPPTDVTSISLFLRICQTFIRGFILSDIWRISEYNSGMTKHSALYSEEITKRSIRNGHILYLYLNLKELEVIDYQGYQFYQRRVVDKDANTPFPVPNTIFCKLLCEHYDPIARKLDYVNTHIKCRYNKRNLDIIFIEIAFIKKLQR